MDFKEREKVKIAAIIDKYGPGFDEVYWEGNMKVEKKQKLKQPLIVLNVDWMKISFPVAQVFP